MHNLRGTLFPVWPMFFIAFKFCELVVLIHILTVTAHEWNLAFVLLLKFNEMTNWIPILETVAAHISNNIEKWLLIDETC